jgi:hypothetical protein
MYLIFTTKQEAEERNRKAITDLNWPSGTTEKRWEELETVNGWALHVGNGHGLTEKELNLCVDKIEIVTNEP